MAEKTKHIVVNNEQLESYVKLVKKDLKTNKNVYLFLDSFWIFTPSHHQNNLCKKRKR